MIGVAAILGATFLFAQFRAHRHTIELRGNVSAFDALSARVSGLEELRHQQFDQAAFDDLKTKVEALRFGQGLRSSR